MEDFYKKSFIGGLWWPSHTVPVEWEGPKLADLVSKGMLTEELETACGQLFPGVSSGEELQVSHLRARGRASKQSG